MFQQMPYPELDALTLEFLGPSAVRCSAFDSVEKARRLPIG
jgi:hypothetical protein